MGNSRKTQAGRGSSESLASQTVAPDTIARPTVQAKHPCTSSLTASLTSRPPSPSYGQYPGRISVEDEDVVFHDASDPTLAGSICISAPSSVPAKQPQRTSGLQQAPLSAPDLETTLFEGDVFYDAATHFTAAEPIVHPATLKPQRASGLQQAPEPCVEGASKGRMNVAPPRSGRSTTPATSNANYYFPAPGRGSSRPAASSVAAAPPAPALGAQPLPSLPSGSIFNPVSGPSKKALLVGIDYLGSKQPLKHATRDATKLGKVLSDVLQFSDENLVFVTDQVRNNTSSCFAPSVRRNHGAATGRSLFGGAPGWKGLVHTEDKKQFVQSSRHNLIEGFRWLVRGAKSGDDLFMLFSGHCAYYNGEGPYIITTGNGGVEDFVSKKDLHEELVLKIPKGCRLHIILDCCNSAALFDLQYCVGSMRPDSDDEPSKDGLCLEVAPPEEACLEEPAAHHITLKSIQAPALVSAPVCEPTTSMCDLSTSSGPERHVPIHGSLYGVSQAVLPADPLPPGSFGEETFASSTVPHRAVKRPGGVVAAPPPANSGPSAITTTGASAAATATSWFTWAKDMVVPSSAPAPAPAAVAEDVKPAAIPNQSAEVRRARNLVAEAPRPIDYFKERKEGYVTPDGEVIIFAAAGAHQPAFEASGGAKSGIVTGAFCKALQTCKDLTHRDLWVSVRGAVDSENKDRERRDLAKDADNRPDPKHRTQHAELWVSQGEVGFLVLDVLVCVLLEFGGTGMIRESGDEDDLGDWGYYLGEERSVMCPRSARWSPGRTLGWDE
ncbi:Ca(2+)-dependent cysteine protease [Ceratobasidium sp. 392]|nr:Ca(2+)-dependent cysteine protease [Ceratobasidium sp. 392]